MRFNIYTAIVYASAKPHIGNTYEIILADAIARYKRMKGYQVYFQTGTDEHGQKIEQKALENNSRPQDYVNEISALIEEIWHKVGSIHDAFVKTTDEKHKAIVAKIFQKLYEQDDIYKGSYEGLYCTPCESFWTKNQLVDDKCPDCNREVEFAKEEAYFFRLSKYAPQLIKHIENNPDFLIPECRKNEIMNQFLKPGLDDLCVSRTSFDWGIPVSFDEKHVIYVWLDALTNYITFPGYDPSGSKSEFKQKWPADLHVIGKDIVRFHAIYWPIFLMALDLPLPKTIFAHPWVLFGNDKMSKSSNNLVYADDLINEFGLDQVRYYLLSQTPFIADGAFSEELLINKVNSELTNNLGNLLNRSLSMVNKYFEGQIPQVTFSKDKSDFSNKIMVLQTEIFEKMDNYYVAEALNKTFEIFDLANKYIEQNAPWVLVKENPEKLKEVIYEILEAIRHGAVLLMPHIPTTAQEILKQLGTNANDFDSLVDFKGLKPNEKIGNVKPLFDKIDKKMP